MDMIKALTDTAVLQLASYPSLTAKQKIKRAVKSCIPGKRPAALDAFSWPNALLAKGLLCVYETTGEKKALDAVADYLKRWKTKGFPINYVDNLMNGTLAMELEEILKGSRDRADRAPQERERSMPCRDTSDPAELCREAADACAAWLKAAPRTQEGLVCYRRQHPDWLFADTLAMVSPFACRYGKERGDKELQELGIRQLSAFWEKGMDAGSGLPYHGYDEKTGMKYGIIGWGRACGWMLLGLAESLPYIETENKAFEALSEAYRELACSVFERQREDGSFSWQLSALEGHGDSSAEGMIGLALMLFGKKQCRTKETSADCSGAKSREAELKKNITRLYELSKTRITEGKVGSCSGECLGFAQYPQVYGSYPWGNGSVLGFLTLWSKEWEE